MGKFVMIKGEFFFLKLLTFFRTIIQNLKVSRQNSIKRLVLTASSDDCSVGNADCEHKCENNMVQGTFIPIGRNVDNYIIYAKSGLDSNGDQWYLHRLSGTGEWEFTWDDWLTTSMIDFNDVGTG